MWHIVRATKGDAIPPRFTTHSPQSHHVFTTTKTVEIAKPLQKQLSRHRKLFFKDRRIKPWELAGKTRSTAFKAMI
jgi:hypothetical protein